MLFANTNAMSKKCFGIYTVANFTPGFVPNCGKKFQTHYLLAVSDRVKNVCQKSHSVRCSLCVVMIFFVRVIVYNWES